jgi:hypothetical protein
MGASQRAMENPVGTLRHSWPNPIAAFCEEKGSVRRMTRPLKSGVCVLTCNKKISEVRRQEGRSGFFGSDSILVQPTSPENAHGHDKLKETLLRLLVAARDDSQEALPIAHTFSFVVSMNVSRTRCYRSVIND